MKLLQNLSKDWKIEWLKLKEFLKNKELINRNMSLCHSAISKLMLNTNKAMQETESFSSYKKKILILSIKHHTPYSLTEKELKHN